ncbi:MAG: hypothetical protein J0H25_05155 [Rhizobiales bacterium]|nr:hypothetical protein [Hyphomicrobiales bacterium]
MTAIIETIHAGDVMRDHFGTVFGTEIWQRNEFSREGLLAGCVSARAFSESRRRRTFEFALAERPDIAACGEAEQMFGLDLARACVGDALCKRERYCEQSDAGARYFDENDLEMWETTRAPSPCISQLRCAIVVRW